jgi:hypothetical protein
MSAFAAGLLGGTPAPKNSALSNGLEYVVGG